MPQSRCPWTLSADNRQVKKLFEGLRGTRRKTLQVALVRAQTIASEHTAKLEKDPRYKKLNSIIATHRKNVERTNARARDAARKLFPEVAKDIPEGSNTTHCDSENYGWVITKAILDPIFDKLRKSLEDLSITLQREARAAETKRKNNCGTTIPQPRDLEAIAKDPSLKSALDAFTDSLAE